jgi:hypothetical protein
MARRVLNGGAMNRVVLAAVLLAASTSIASAGTYVGLGIGSAPSVSDSANDPYRSDGRSGRLALGWRMGRFSVEGALSGFSYVQANSPGDGHYDSRSGQIAGKFNYPLGDNFEAFGRVGLLRTQLTPTSTTGGDVTGDGYTLGAGFEYRLNLGVAGGSLFVDYSRNQATFGTGASAVDQTGSMWTLGVNVSL